MKWIQKNIDKYVHVLKYGIPDHALLCLKGEEVRKISHIHFKFINSVIEIEGDAIEVRNRWR